MLPISSSWTVDPSIVQPDVMEEAQKSHRNKQIQGFHIDSPREIRNLIVTMLQPLENVLHFAVVLHMLKHSCHQQ